MVEIRSRNFRPIDQDSLDAVVCWDADHAQGAKIRHGETGHSRGQDTNESYLFGLAFRDLKNRARFGDPDGRERLNGRKLSGCKASGDEIDDPRIHTFEDGADANVTDQSHFDGGCIHPAITDRGVK